MYDYETSQYIFSRADEYTAFALEHGLGPIDENSRVLSEDYKKFIYAIPNEPCEPLVIDPTPNDTRKLGPGAVVAIHFDHGSRERAFIVRLATVRVGDFEYHTAGEIHDSLMELDDPMISYDPRQLANWVEDESEKLILDLDGNKSCNASHIIKIYDFGQKITRHQNRLYEMNQKNMSRQLRLRKHDAEKGNRKRRSSVYEGHQAWNESYRTSESPRIYRTSTSTVRGIYNGNLYELTKAIVMRRPSLQIRTDIDPDRFWDLYEKSGKPGWTGDYYSYFCNYDYDEEGNRVQKPSRRLFGKVRIKSFTQWVLKNYRKMVHPVKEYENLMQKRCREIEIDEMKSYEKGMGDEWRYRSVFHVPDTEEVEEDIDAIYD